jgi:hypothetical protein
MPARKIVVKSWKNFLLAMMSTIRNRNQRSVLDADEESNVNYLDWTSDEFLILFSMRVETIQVLLQNDYNLKLYSLCIFTVFHYTYYSRAWPMIYDHKVKHLSGSTNRVIPS